MLVEQHGAEYHPHDHSGFSQGRDSCERPTRLGPQHDEVRGEGERTAKAAQSPVRGRRRPHPHALRDERVQREGYGLSEHEEGGVAGHVAGAPDAEPVDQGVCGDDQPGAEREEQRRGTAGCHPLADVGQADEPSRHQHDTDGLARAQPLAGEGHGEQGDHQRRRAACDRVHLVQVADAVGGHQEQLVGDVHDGGRDEERPRRGRGEAHERRRHERDAAGRQLQCDEADQWVLDRLRQRVPRRV